MSLPLVAERGFRQEIDKNGSLLAPPQWHTFFRSPLVSQIYKLKLQSLRFHNMARP